MHADAGAALSAKGQKGNAFGQSNSNHQTPQLKLADMVTKVEGAKQLIEAAARRCEAGER